MYVSQQEKVYSTIREQILNGVLENNSRVTERELAKSLNVTRVPVRESLATLEKEGLIVKIPSVGYIVENYSPDEFSEALILRITIECYSAQKAAKNATEEDIFKLKVLCEGQREAGLSGDYEKATDYDRKFHAAIVNASYSKLLKKVYSLISIPVFIPRNLPESDLFYTVKDHENIVKAIENRDPESAFLCSYKHTPGRDYYEDCWKIIHEKGD